MHRGDPVFSNDPTRLEAFLVLLSALILLPFGPAAIATYRLCRRLIRPAVNSMRARVREDENRTAPVMPLSVGGFPIFPVPSGTATFSSDDVRRAEDAA
jgi:hypothetical protein